MDKKKQIIMGEHGIPNSFEYTSIPKTSSPLEEFKKVLSIKIYQEKDRELEFDLINCNTALANAYRRILLSEIPSMAIDKVYIVNNSSLMQDEILAHRLGLIPLRADPRLFEYPSSENRNDEVSDQDTLRYEIKIVCGWNQQAPKNSYVPEDIYLNSNVYSKDIKWIPIGQQAERFPQGVKEMGVLEDDILICKLRPAQEIHAYMHAIKGISKDHAKFSPVATATYRLLPDIQLIKPVKGEMAVRLQKCFNPGVIEITKREGDSEENCEARVSNARYDACSRNVFLHKDLKDCVKLSRVPDHFIFNIESVGTLPPAVLFIEAVKVLKHKCKAFIEEIGNLK